MFWVGIKSGCWTLLHRGHIWAIQEAARQCEWLIVLTNTDDYIRRKKGSVPIVLEDRLYMLRHIVGVDEVGFFAGPTEEPWIRQFKRERLYNEFGEWATLTVFHSDELRGQPEVPAQNIADEIVFIDKVSRPESVTDIYQKIREGHE